MGKFDTAAGEASPSRCFFQPEIDHFVMAITAAEATVRHSISIERLELPQRLDGSYVVYLALYRRRLCWLRRRRPPRPASGEAAN
jgi:hypothetical protein